MNVIDNIRQQIYELKYANKKPKFVVLDIDTWYNIKANIGKFREYVWFGFEQKDTRSSDKILGIPVALVTGNEGGVVKVVT